MATPTAPNLVIFPLTRGCGAPHTREPGRVRDNDVHDGPAEHYESWRRELPQADLPWGVFGENLTTEGLLEAGIRIGDRFRVGSTEFVATQPRIPCYKLGIRFGRPDIVKRFLQS